MSAVTLPPPSEQKRGSAQPVPAVRTGSSRAPGLLGARAAIDGLVCLALSVLILRTFLVEGYMISTGSMAPALYGYHKRVVCPLCGEVFARGVAFDGSTAVADEEDEHPSSSGAHSRVSCPNCGAQPIDIGGVPRNHGDQLLVLKHVYGFRLPQRWEVVVFRNPAHATQAFVKRVVGLPGERIQVIDGDVYANGEICRKSFANQRAVRIPVFDTRRLPDDPQWKARWRGDDGWQTHVTNGQRDFTFAAGKPSAGMPHRDAQLTWLSYRHRATNDAPIETAVKVERLPLGFEFPDSPIVEPVRFDADPHDVAAGTLVATGPVSADWEHRLRDLSADADYQRSISELVARSRRTPVTDSYAYNRSQGVQHAVTDVMIEFQLRLRGTGKFAIELSDGPDAFRLILDATKKTLSLRHTPQSEDLRTAPLPDAFFSAAGALVEMSVMDRQVLVAIDGEEPFAAWTFERSRAWERESSNAIRLGAQQLEASVESLVLYRDVFYTRGRGVNGVDKPFVLEEDEFFVLGDNSPVSLDSRSWEDGALKQRLLLGKPFVVHLPSRPAAFQFGERRWTVRVPDFSRMRYIR